MLFFLILCQQSTIVHFSHIFHWFFEISHIFESKFVINDLNISNRVNFTFDVGDIVVFEYSQHMENCVASRNMGQKSISKTLTFISSFNQTGNINNIQISRNFRSGFMIFAEHVEPIVWYCNSGFVRVNSTKWEIFGGRGGFGKNVEKG